MQAKKLEFANSVINIVRDVCGLAFNISTDEGLKNLFGMEQKQIEMTIKKIIDALPDDTFAWESLAEEIKNICAREFVFFQVQAKDVPSYQEDLTQFIEVFSRDIRQRIDVYQDYSSRMKGE